MTSIAVAKQRAAFLCFRAEIPLSFLRGLLDLALRLLLSFSSHGKEVSKSSKPKCRGQNVRLRTMIDPALKISWLRNMLQKLVSGLHFM